MEFTYQKVSIQKVDLKDETFMISYGFDLHELKESIAKVGLIHPPIIQKVSSEQYRIVCGFKRISVLDTLGCRQFTAALLPEEVTEKDTFLLSLHENLTQRGLNPVETALVINKLKRYFAMPEITEEFLPLLKLGKSSSLLTMYESILGLEEEIKMGMAKGEMNKETVPMLLKFSSKERMVLFQFITRLKLSRSKQVEVLENISVIRERDGVDADKILDSEEVEEILSDQRTGLIAQGDQIRDYIKRLRYPRLTKAEEVFREKKEKMKLKGIELIPPPYFEGEEFRINYSFNSVREFKKRLEMLQSIADEDEFKEIIEG
jgi:ParB-like chromosome segregation protein Spo0J